MPPATITAPAHPDLQPGPARQRAHFLTGLVAPPAIPINPTVLEAQARRRLSQEAFAYLAGGAGMEYTLAANRAAFDRWRLVPRVLRDVSRRDLRVELAGRTLPAPFLLAPVGVLELFHREADVAVARAASAAGLPMVFSNQASRPMEACAEAMGDGPRWFQLYWSRSDALVDSFLARAEACGCEAIVLTLDTTMLGWRSRDLQLGYLPFLHGRGLAQYTSDPVFRAALDTPLAEEGSARIPLGVGALATWAGQLRRYPGGWWRNLRSGEPRKAVRRFLATYSRPSLTWDNVAELRRRTRLPIFLKGILHPEDAHRAAASGVAGIIVSNHGGRQVDRAVASLDALPGVVAAVGGRIPVLVDGGIRTGADAAIALALGARAVLIGRPYAYGLAFGGEDGVAAVLQNLVAEFDLTLGLLGCRELADLTPDCLTEAPAQPGRNSESPRP